MMGANACTHPQSLAQEYQSTATTTARCCCVHVACIHIPMQDQSYNKQIAYAVPPSMPTQPCNQKEGAVNRLTLHD